MFQSSLSAADWGGVGVESRITLVDIIIRTNCILLVTSPVRCSGLLNINHHLLSDLTSSNQYSFVIKFEGKKATQTSHSQGEINRTPLPGTSSWLYVTIHVSVFIFCLCLRLQTGENKSGKYKTMMVR